MRVGLVIYGSLDTLSGGYLYDRQLAAALRRWGDEVTVISVPWRSYARHLADNASADLLRRMSAGFDVLLQDELNHPSLAWANDRLGPGRPPLVAIVHHLRASEPRPAWQNRLYGWVERRYLRSVDAFVYNSHTTRRAAEALNGQAKPNLVAYPAGDRFAPPSPTERPAGGPLRLLFVGNLIPRKGLDTLLRALARVRGEWRLVVVGRPSADPAHARALRRLAAELELGNRVAWRGGVGDDELAAELAAADVLAVPSQYEGFGIVYLEGMAFGLPAIATTAGAAHEIITDGVNGFLVPPGDGAAMAERIERLAADRALLARMGAAAWATFERHPTWEETTTRIRRFLVEIAGVE